MQSACAVLSSVACLPPPHFSPLSHKEYDFRKKKLCIKRGFWFSLRHLSEICFILRIIQRDIVINVKTFSCKTPVILVKHINEPSFSGQSFETAQISNFIKIRLVGTNVFHMDRHDKADSCFSHKNSLPLGRELKAGRLESFDGKIVVAYLKLLAIHSIENTKELKKKLIWPFNIMAKAQVGWFRKDCQRLERNIRCCSIKIFRFKCWILKCCSGICKNTISNYNNKLKQLVLRGT